MTGRHLYDKYTDAYANQTWTHYRDNHPPLLAWPLLSQTEQRIWNDTARRLTPKRSKAVKS